jgi:hypothetical protein
MELRPQSWQSPSFQMFRPWSPSEYAYAISDLDDTRSKHQNVVQREDLMSDDTIRNLLRELHSTLDGSTSITEKDRELLKQLSVDIQALLAQPGGMTRAGHQSMIDRLAAAVTHFEVSHPDLTATITQVSKALGDMGI